MPTASPGLTSRSVLRFRAVPSRNPALVLASLALLAAAPAAVAGARPGAIRAAEVSIVVEPAIGVRYGAETTVGGTLAETGAPLAGQPVVLEARRFPFDGAWEPLATATTDAAGAFLFERELDRNHRLRVRHEPTGAVSAIRTAFVFPSFTLAFEERDAGVIRITQLYRVPAEVRLTARTRFYIGSQEARRARLRATVPTRRVRAGRYRAVARVTIPDSYGGRFRYVSCFRYSRGSGMGDPSRRCPRRFFPLR
jgi:hypothetical protein